MFEDHPLFTLENIYPWESGRPVAWIEEMGRRVTRINERLLAHHWLGGLPEQYPRSALQLKEKSRW